MYGLPLSKSDDLTFSVTQSKSDTPIQTGDGGSTLTRGHFLGLRWQHELDPSTGRFVTIFRIA